MLRLRHAHRGPHVQKPREREREREIYIYTHTYMYAYVYIQVYTYTHMSICAITAHGRFELARRLDSIVWSRAAAVSVVMSSASTRLLTKEATLSLHLRALHTSNKSRDVHGNLKLSCFCRACFLLPLPVSRNALPWNLNQ